MTDKPRIIQRDNVAKQIFRFIGENLWESVGKIFLLELNAWRRLARPGSVGDTLPCYARPSSA